MLLILFLTENRKKSNPKTNHHPLPRQQMAVEVNDYYVGRADDNLKQGAEGL